ncbi:hypothetical protein EJD97_003361 [Solanum chilense]|uniref:Calmodulin-binding domain-containing protein n=1 Tax=Solanum chilense TaxID=4083 RepID=A0A6N2BTS0_SOLCI|nr:hypothetical protein EJD97_003361 [Solanum chilense]
MATKTRDIAPIVKGKRSPSPSKTRSLAHTNAINLIASNRKNTYLKSKVSSSHDKTQGKKPTPTTYPNIHHKQTLDCRSSIDKPPSNFDNTQVKKNPTLLNELNIVHNKPNVARGSLFDNKPSLPSSLDNVQAKKIGSSSSSIHNKQNPTQRRLSFDSKPPQSPSLDHNTHVIEDNGELSENVNIDEYLKAAESSSLYVVENQEVIKNMEVAKEEQQLDIIENHEEVEQIKNLEPSNHDVEEIEKQENENQEEKEKDQENETQLDDCEQKKDEGKELDLKIDQEESEGRNNKEKEENNNKVSTTTMTFAKAYTHLVHKKEIVVSSNDVIEETASKLREQRKNRVKALASAFETVISLQDSK